MQIAHGGSVMSGYYTWLHSEAPSGIPSVAGLGGEVPSALSVEEIKDVGESACGRGPQGQGRRLRRRGASFRSRVPGAGVHLPDPQRAEGRLRGKPGKPGAVQPGDHRCGSRGGRRRRFHRGSPRIRGRTASGRLHAGRRKAVHAHVGAHRQDRLHQRHGRAVEEFHVGDSADDGSAAPVRLLRGRNQAAGGHPRLHGHPDQRSRDGQRNHQEP